MIQYAICGAIGAILGVFAAVGIIICWACREEPDFLGDDNK